MDAGVERTDDSRDVALPQPGCLQDALLLLSVRLGHHQLQAAGSGGRIIFLLVLLLLVCSTFDFGRGCFGIGVDCNSLK